MPAIRTLPAAAIALCSFLGVIIYSRARVLQTFYANASRRLQHINNFDNVEVKFRDIIRNCEDVVLDLEAGFALLSCDPGRDTWNTVMGTFLDSKSPPETGLYIWHYANNNAEAGPEKLKLLDFASGLQHFHPLGIDYHAPSNTIFIVNHAPAGPSIEMFRLFLSDTADTHTGTIKHSLIAAPNAIAAVSEEELFVTNDHRFVAKDHPMLTQLETGLGYAGGSVVHVDLASILEPKVHSLAKVPFANGIVQLKPDSLAVASSSMNEVYVYRINSSGEGAPPSLTKSDTVPVSFHPDNLSVDEDGKLLIAGHPHAPNFEKIAKSAARCNDSDEKSTKDCVKGLSWIAEWTEKDGVRDLYVGDEYGTSSTAVRDVKRHAGIAVGLYERGVLMWNS